MLMFMFDDQPYFDLTAITQVILKMSEKEVLKGRVNIDDKLN